MGAGVGASNVGFVLSFIDEASKPLRTVTNAYNKLTKSIDAAIKKASEVARFVMSMDAISKSLEKVNRAGAKAYFSLHSLSGVTSKGVKIPKMAEGGIVNKPTVAQIGEKGPEAVVPLDRYNEFMGQSIGVFMEGTEALFKTATDMFEKFKLVKNEWENSFGKDSKENWEKIDKSSKNTSKSLKDVFNVVKDVKVMTALNNLNNAFESIFNVGKIGDADQAIQSFQKSTNRLSQSRGYNRKQVMEMRDLERDAYRGLIIDVNRASDVLSDLADDTSIKLDNNLIKLSARMAGFGEISGVDVTNNVVKLQRQISLMGDDFLDIVTLSRKTSNSMEINFKNVYKYVDPVLDSLSVIKKDLSDMDKKSVVRGLFSIASSLEKAGIKGEAASKVMDLLTASLIDLDTRKAFMRAGFDPLKALKEGHPEKVIEQLQGMSEAVRAGTLGGLKMGQVYQDKFNVASDILLNLRGNTEGMIKTTEEYNKRLFGTGQTLKEINDELKNQKALGDQVKRGFTNWTSVQPILSFISDHLESIPALLLGIHAGFMLLKDVPDSIKGMNKSIGNFRKNIKNTIKDVRGLHLGTMLLSKAKLVLSSVTSVLSKSIKMLNLSFLASPLFWIPAAIALVVGGFILLYKHCDAFRNVVDKVWSGIKIFGNFLLGVGIKALHFYIGYWKLLFKVVMIPINFLIKSGKYLWEIFSKTSPGKGLIHWIKSGIDLLMKPLGWLWDKLSGIWGLLFSGKTSNIDINKKIMESPSTVLEKPSLVSPEKKSNIEVSSSNGKMDININQEDVVDRLDKILVALMNGNKNKKSAFRSSNSGYLSPDRLAINGEM
jgi:hypothetical protein